MSARIIKRNENVNNGEENEIKMFDIIIPTVYNVIIKSKLRVKPLNKKTQYINKKRTSTLPAIIL